MSAISEVMAVLMDALEEAGDTEAVEALRNLEQLKKVQKHLPTVLERLEANDEGGDCVQCGYYDHYRNCDIALARREVLGQVEVDRQIDESWDAALREKARRERPPSRTGSRLLDMVGFNAMLKETYSPSRIAQITGLSGSVAPPAIAVRVFGEGHPVVSVIADKNVPEGTAYMLAPLVQVDPALAPPLPAYLATSDSDPDKDPEK